MADGSYWKMHTDLYPTVKDAVPNACHTLFHYLHEQGKLAHVITQVYIGVVFVYIRI